MSLRQKLLLVALSMLALPWAGWQFVRQMEVLLRQGQEQTLIASGRALARSLAAIGAELPPLGPALYVHEAGGAVQVDGYGEEWALQRGFAQNLGPPSDAHRLKLMLSADENWLYLFADVRDATHERADANDPQALRTDHVALTMQRDGATRRYVIASAAPGPFEARVVEGDVDAGPLPPTLNGEWQEDGGGYRIELRLPISQMPHRLGISQYDSAAGAAATTATEPLPLLGYSPRLAHELGQFAPEATRTRLLSAEGWLVGESGKRALTENAPKAQQQPSLPARVAYRWLIAPALLGTPALAGDAPRVDAAELWQALSGVPAASWRPGSGPGDVVLVAAVPLTINGEARGALLLEQSNAALPLLTDAALKRLALISVIVLALAGGVLFAFASWLSVRIRRLRDGAERALAADGRVEGRLPSTEARDELGDLARSFQRLLDAVGAYTDYLRTLASKLSHELHTPLAIVKSSLDNLDHHAVPPDVRAYLGRARDGVERLGAIVRAMSEASRIERAIASADAEDFDLVHVVRGCADAYRVLAAPRRVECDVGDVPVPVHGAPELIAQALDKLFDNARSFTPETGSIRLSLRGGADVAEIRVGNDGPPLPAAMQGRLFDSLVSVRDTTARGETPHLGLGLYVVRLIAERHGGTALARNLPDGSGVEFVLRIAGMRRIASREIPRA